MKQQTNVTIEGLKIARASVHKLSGLLTGVSLGLYCNKYSQEAGAAAADIFSLIDEAQAELSKLRSTLQQLEKLQSAEDIC